MFNSRDTYLKKNGFFIIYLIHKHNKKSKLNFGLFIKGSRKLNSQKIELNEYFKNLFIIHFTK